MSADDPKRPRMTSGPSLPVHGVAAREHFGRGAEPGRDPPPTGEQHKPAPSYAPSVSLPTGGGALRSIGEKFSSNLFTGAGTMTVPIATSPGRGGFGPTLALDYSTGFGNGPFGLGWQLGVPAISRKTEKGVPEYRDEEPDPWRRDIFILAGAEDLVQTLDDDGKPWQQIRDGHVIHRFRPRVEGGFARIERWTSQATGEVHWRTISPSNVTSLFGKTTDTRIFDPQYPERIFSWLLEESHDDRGNIITYEWAQENLADVDPHAPAERSRLADQLIQPQRYLSRIRYGNAVPFVKGGWLFELAFDYGGHGTWHGEQLEVSPDAARPWPARLDIFSSCRAGFEIRTRRLCRRVLMFHHFAELGPDPYLVASTDFIHEHGPAATHLTGVVQRSYRRDAQTGHYEVASRPALEFEYSKATFAPERERFHDPETLRGLPAAYNWRQSRLIDLDGEGLPGILIEHGSVTHYQRGIGQGRFGPKVPLTTRPVQFGMPDTQLMDIDGDGRKELVSFSEPLPGFVRRLDDETWGNFQHFASLPNIDWRSQHAQLIDLTGDGFPDIVMDTGEAFVIYRSRGADGFEPARTIPHGPDARRPMLMTSDKRYSIQFADMTGDGLIDIVRIGNGEVVYWPNLGHGRFGSKIHMPGLELFEIESLWNPERLRLADVDGSGTTDIIYLTAFGATYYRNLAGNAFAPGEPIPHFPGQVATDWVEVVDVKGIGTAQLTWSTRQDMFWGGMLCAIDLMGGHKPHLLIGIRNNMGAETRIAYAPSTRFYATDRRRGRPWVTKLPFPVQVVERIETIDHITRRRFVRRFVYRHGYFDGHEREFRGFGLVESWDTEYFHLSKASLFDAQEFDPVEAEQYQPPVYQKTWFHTGAYLGRRKHSRMFAAEYWQGDPQAFALPDSVLPSGLDGEDAREAVRSLAGKVLRTEVYAADLSADRDKPYVVTETNFAVRRLQGRGFNRHGVYLAHERESVTHHYERHVEDPRVGHSAVLDVDDYGTVLRSAAVAYPRRGTVEPAEQAALHVTVGEAAVVHLDGEADVLRIAVPIESRSFELLGLAAPVGRAFAWPELRNVAAMADRRLLTRTRLRYMADDLSGPLPVGIVESKALAFDSESAAMTEAQWQDVFGGLAGTPTHDELVSEGGYVFDDGLWWARSGHPTYDATKFYTVTGHRDPFGNPLSISFDQYALMITGSTDPLGNSIAIENDYRVLAPWQITDPNGNRSQVAFDVLGFVVASAVLGKVGDDDGDTLEDPTSTFEYDLFAWQTSGKPNWSRTRVRETHQDPNTRWLEQRTYFDGSGGVVMVKAQARPGPAPLRDESGELVLADGKPVLTDTSPNLRWIGTGRIVTDNKGNLIKAYEPYYSSTAEFEDEAELVEQGVTAINRYDPLGRVLRTDLPNGTFSKIEFTPWETITWDANDTVLQSDWYGARLGYEGDDIARQKERRAAELAAAHADTPTRAHLDTLGRPFLAVADAGDGELHTTRSVLDVQGRLLAVIDARGNTAETREYGMLGQALKISSVDAGERRQLPTAVGEPMRTWDSRGQRFAFKYDALRRPTDRAVAVADGPEKLLERVVYGELLDNPTATNHRGRVLRVYDGAGAATTVAYDFKGHPQLEQRQLVADPKAQPDWSPLLGSITLDAMTVAAAPLFDTETFSASSSRDVLGRVLTAISPDDSTVSYLYDEGGALQRVDLEHRGGQTKETVVGDITYNARGQRERVAYGDVDSPTTTTTYTYDPTTFRLQRLSTIRSADQAALQRLHYHFDPVGNVTDIRDTAQQTVYFQNTVVEAANAYTYDPLYRLVEATGREHASLGTGQRTHEQLPIGPQPMATDPAAMRRYRQRFTYDPAGNMLRMQHIPDAGSGWTRHYQYVDDGNRLLATSAPGDAANGPYSHAYAHDAHGNMTAMPHLAAMHWNHDDQLEHAIAGTEHVYFQYAGSSRSCKYTEKQGSVTEERIYLGPFEIYRKRINGTLDLERETLHISDDTGRICMVETKTVADASPVQQPIAVWRYQLSNYLGTATTEVTRDGDIISHEEYHPYGTSAYRAVDASIDVSPKRYRYTGMERDDETGLGYHTARYYAPWLGRWTSADLSGLIDGLNRFAYCRGSPVTLSDPNGSSPPQTEPEPPPRRPGHVASEHPDESEMAQAYREFVEQTQAEDAAAGRTTAPRHTTDAAEPDRTPTGPITIDPYGVELLEKRWARERASERLKEDVKAMMEARRHEANERTLDNLQTALDVVGTVVPLADVANAGVSAARGDYDAAASHLSGVPPGGKELILVGKGLRAARKAKQAERKAERAAAKARKAQEAASTGRGMRNPKVRQAAQTGNEAHRQIEAGYQAQGYQTEVTIALEGAGKKVRKDAKKGTEVVIIKPDTPSGRRSAKRRERLMQNEGYETRVDLYDPKDPAWQPGSPTYIGPRGKK